ncbi:hypothetical protein AB0H18_43810, partial [Streptomyces sp. NPDC020766]
GGNEGLLVAFLGDLDEEQATVLAKMRQRSAPRPRWPPRSWSGPRAAGCARWSSRPGRAGGCTTPDDPPDHRPTPRRTIRSPL